MKLRLIKACLILTAAGALVAGCASNNTDPHAANFDLAFPPGPQANVNP